MFKRTCFCLFLCLVFSLLPAYMTVNNEVYLKVLVQKGSKIDLVNEGLVFINGRDYQSNKIQIQSLSQGKVKIILSDETFIDSAHKFEISLTGNFYLAGKSNQQFSGDIHIRDYQGELAVMNLMNLESYTRYVVVNEIGAGAPVEALKSQAIIARSYAIYESMKNNSVPWDLRADTNSQVFNTKKEIPQKIIQASNDTAYMLVTYQNQVAFTPFNSYSGGYIADVSQVWGGSGFPYLSGKADVSYLERKDMSNYKLVKDWIEKDPGQVYDYYDKLPNWIKANYQWERRVPFTLIQSRANIAKIYSCEITERDRSGRIKTLTFNTSQGKVRITSQDRIRYILNGIPSTLAIIKVKNNSLIIKGKGYGHGVGFCQSGGYLKSYAGWSYDRIIKHYYPGCDISIDYFFSSNGNDEIDQLLNNN